MDILSNFTENFQQYILDVINEKRHGRTDIFLRAILFVASRVYRNLTQLRHWLYDKRIIRDHSIGCLVVSIGNLTCGGTGKTPVVEVFARTLSQKGRKVAVLSRGYKSKDKRSLFTKLKQKFLSKEREIPPRVVSDGKNLLLDADTAGDEPYMLASNLPNVIVIVDKDRVKAGLYSIEKFQTDTLILDDGFQYLD
ncbi:MAG: tetraacyldisaccharide 4'-kinase, partial [Bacteroidetes bacterium]